jgi:hypothetical protein
LVALVGFLVYFWKNPPVPQAPPPAAATTQTP